MMIEIEGNERNFRLFHVCLTTANMKVLAFLVVVSFTDRVIGTETISLNGKMGWEGAKGFSRHGGIGKFNHNTLTGKQQLEKPLNVSLNMRTLGYTNTTPNAIRNEKPTVTFMLTQVTDPKNKNVEDPKKLKTSVHKEVNIRNKKHVICKNRIMGFNQRGKIIESKQKLPPPQKQIKKVGKKKIIVESKQHSKNKQVLSQSKRPVRKGKYPTKQMRPREQTTENSHSDALIVHIKRTLEQIKKEKTKGRLGLKRRIGLLKLIRDDIQQLSTIDMRNDPIQKKRFFAIQAKIMQFIKQKESEARKQIEKLKANKRSVNVLQRKRLAGLKNGGFVIQPRLKENYDNSAIQKIPSIVSEAQELINNTSGLS